MPVQNILCISIDGLRASALGAYGNTWHPTPALDAFASQSQVFDWMFCDRPTLEGFFDSVWRLNPPPLEGGISDESMAGKSGSNESGENPSPNLSPQGRGTLAQRLADAGIQASLTTDDRSIADRAEASGFAEIRRLDFTSSESAPTIADTELAQLFAVAIDQLAAWAETDESSADQSTSRLLWLHARGYRGAWDAPLELRQSLLDEGDPPAPTFVTPPGLAAVHDHDPLLLYRAAYAAQTMALDECVGALMAALADFGLGDNTLVILVGARGYALGEHGAVGGDAQSLYGELIHVPCIVHAPGAIGPPPRSPRLVQPADIGATIIDALALQIPEESAHGGSLLALENVATHSRQFIKAVGDGGERVIRTPAWMLRVPPTGSPTLADAAAGASSGVELYRKPDDRWEANEIANRMTDVTARLLAALDRSSSAEPLEDDLLSHPR